MWHCCLLYRTNTFTFLLVKDIVCCVKTISYLVVTVYWRRDWIVRYIVCVDAQLSTSHRGVQSSIPQAILRPFNMASHEGDWENRDLPYPEGKPNLATPEMIGRILRHQALQFPYEHSLLWDGEGCEVFPGSTRIIRDLFPGEDSQTSPRPHEAATPTRDYDPVQPRKQSTAGRKTSRGKGASNAAHRKQIRDQPPFSEGGRVVS